MHQEHSCHRTSVSSFRTHAFFTILKTPTRESVYIRQCCHHTSSSLLLHCRGLSLPRYCCCSSNHNDARETTESVLNKRRVDNALFEYIIDHSREDDVLKELRQVTAERFPRAAKMAVGPEQGAFLGWLVDLMGVRRAIEIGVFTGYSSICIAKSMGPESTLFALDRDPVAMDTAREFWQRSDLVHRIDGRCGNGMELLEDISTTYGENWCDFAFVDANKKGYRDYYEMLLPMMRVGGVIAIDNVLWYGKVADGESTDATTESLRALNRYIREDERVTMTLVPIGDGILLCTKR